MFRVTFTFLPKECYKERFLLNPGKILDFMEKTYIKKLISTIRMKINSLAKTQMMSSGTNRSIRLFQRAGPSEEGDEAQKGPEEAEDDDDEEADGDDGDAAAVKEKSHKNEEQEYEKDEDQDEGGESTEDGKWTLSSILNPLLHRLFLDNDIMFYF